MNKITYVLVILFVTVGTYWYITNSNSTFSRYIPQPTGLHKVGTESYHLIDPARKERHSLNPNDNRELMIQIWYPAQATEKDTKALYANGSLEFIKKDISKHAEIPIEQLTHLDSLKSYSVAHAPLSLTQETYPVIIFSPGFGTPVNLYSSLLEDLASHGYITVGINYPYVTNPVIFPDNRVIMQASKLENPKDKKEKEEERNTELKTWIADNMFVLDQLEDINKRDTKNILTGKINLDRVGILGHSFGGSVAVEVCQSDKRCTAGVDIEGKLYSPIAPERLIKPFMFIAAPHEQQILKPVKDLVTTSRARTYYFEIEGTDHGSFTDLYLLARWPKQPILSPQKAIDTTRSLLVDFFDAYLKDKIENQETGVCRLYSELCYIPMQ
jgi:dienelactone hydrolase